MPDDRNPLRNLSRRHFVIGGVLATASAIAYAREPKVVARPIDNKRFESLAPDTVGGWRVAGSSGVVLPPPDAMRDRIYDNLLTRVYVGEGLPVIMLLIAYNNVQDGVLQIHRPEVCYPVGGFALGPTTEQTLRIGEKAIPCNLFTAVSDTVTEHVLYYTRLGSDFPRSWAEQRLAVFKANLLGAIPDGLLVRFSIVGDDMSGAVPTMTRFANEFMEKSPPQFRQLLIGASGTQST